MNSDHKKIVILGGGIAGLMIGYALSKRGIKDYVILEGSKNEEELLEKSHIYYIHNPIDAVAHLLEKKRIQTWAWWNGNFRDRATPLMCNIYSQRITDKTLTTAIHHLDGVQKYGYFPESGDLKEIVKFYLANQQGSIKYGQWVIGVDEENKVVATKSEEQNNDAIIYTVLINTLPLPIILNMIGMKTAPMQFKPIYIIKAKAFKTQDIFQEIYIPNTTESSFYRMLLYGDTAIAEMAVEPNLQYAYKDFKKDFLRLLGVETAGDAQFNTLPSGRFVPIDAIERKKIIRNLTDRYGIMSFGRYGTWSYKRTDHLAQDAEDLIEIMKQKQLLNGDTL